MCPKDKSGKVCSDHGVCSYGKCWCYDDFVGEDCAKSIDWMDRIEEAHDAKCPANDEGVECSGHGTCYLGQCECRIGWFGEMCSENKIKGNFESDG
jgi:hypothetical protein